MDRITDRLPIFARPAATFVVLTLPVLGGCRGEENGPEARSADERDTSIVDAWSGEDEFAPPTSRNTSAFDIRQSPELAGYQQRRPVAMGTLPLVVRMVGEGSAVVTDAATGEVVAEVTGEAGQFLVVNEQGVRVGDALVRPVRLDQGQSFAIYLDTEIESAGRVTTLRPVPAAVTPEQPPTSRPAEDTPDDPTDAPNTVVIPPIDVDSVESPR